MCYQFLETSVLLSVLQCPIKIFMHILLFLIYDIFAVTNVLSYQHPGPAYIMQNAVQWYVHDRVPIAR
jgi:hypothetical protein